MDNINGVNVFTEVGCAVKDMTMEGRPDVIVTPSMLSNGRVNIVIQNEGGVPNHVVVSVNVLELESAVRACVDMNRRAVALAGSLRVHS